MGAMKEIDLLKEKLEELEKQNNDKRTILCSLQLVIGDLKSENERLKMEQQERVQRLEQMTKAKENMKRCREFNSTLTKLLLEQKAVVKRYQTQPANHCDLIKSHESIQEALKEKILKLKEEHENLPIVKRCNELQREEAKILEKAQQTENELQEEERMALNKLNKLDAQIFKRIVGIVVKNKLLADFESEVVAEVMKESQKSFAESQTKGSVIHKVARPPITIQKLDDLVFPEIPVAPQKSKLESKIDVQAMLANIRKQIQQSLGNKYTQESNTRLQNSKIPHKEEKNAKTGQKMGTHVKNSPEGKMKSSVLNMDETHQQSNLQGNSNKSVDQVAHKVNLQNRMETWNNDKSTNEKIVLANGQKASNQEVTTMQIPQNSKKIVVLSDILVKKAATDLSQEECNTNQPRQPIGPKREQYPQHDKLIAETRKNNPNNQQAKRSDTATTKMQVQDKFPPKQTTLKRKASHDETVTELKPSPPKNAKGIKVQSLDNTPIDLNSEMPSSHITINSSSESNKNDEAMKQPSPTGSLNNFFNEYSFDATSPNTSDRKRKRSPNPTSFEGGIDFDNFDFGKKSKNGSDACSDDFLNMLGASPAKGAGGDDNTMFDFEAFVGF